MLHVWQWVTETTAVDDEMNEDAAADAVIGNTGHIDAMTGIPSSTVQTACVAQSTAPAMSTFSAPTAGYLVGRQTPTTVGRNLVVAGGGDCPTPTAGYCGAPSSSSRGPCTGGIVGSHMYESPRFKWLTMSKEGLGSSSTETLETSVVVNTARDDVTHVNNGRFCILVLNVTIDLQSIGCSQNYQQQRCIEGVWNKNLIIVLVCIYVYIHICYVYIFIYTHNLHSYPTQRILHIQSSKCQLELGNIDTSRFAINDWDSIRRRAHHPHQPSMRVMTEAPTAGRCEFHPLQLRYAAPTVASNACMWCQIN